MKKALSLLATAVLVNGLAFGLATPAAAQVPTDCPPGSVGKTEGANSWCEVTVCNNDGDCTPQVCRSVALCIQVGTLDKDGGAALQKDKGAANRVIAVGRCAADNKCPENTVCNEKKRCVDRAVADKMSAPLEVDAGAGGAGKKSSCGCETVGARVPLGGAGVFAAALGLGLIARRRTRRVV
jgi:hypothetical protein